MSSSSSSSSWQIFWGYNFGACLFFQVHVAASECLEEVTKLYRDYTQGAGGGEVQVPFKSELLHQWEIEKNEQAKSLMKNCIDIIDTLQHKSL